MALTDLVDKFGLLSVLFVWAALIWRGRSALRLRYQFGLWITVLAGTIATTLFQPWVVAQLTGMGADIDTIVMVRNLIGVLSAGLLLLFIVDSTHAPLMRAAVIGGMTIAVGTLLLLGLTDGEPAGNRSVQQPAALSSSYVLILAVSHLIGDSAATAVCWTYSRRSEDRDLVWSLRLFAAGSSITIVFWAGYLVDHFFPIPGGVAGLSVLLGFHGFLRAVSLLVPTGSALVGAALSLRVIWVLWPLWRDLTSAAPQVALVQPRKTRLEEVLRPSAPLALQAHRQTIETYDAILELQQYTSPGTYDEAREHAREAGFGDDRIAAAALASALGASRRVKLSGAPPSAPCPLPGLEHCTQATLLDIARVWS